MEHWEAKYVNTAGCEAVCSRTLFVPAGASNVGASCAGSATCKSASSSFQCNKGDVDQRPCNYSSDEEISVSLYYMYAETF